MSKYPSSIAGPGDLPTRLDGSVIYGAHMNAVQDEIIAIETTLGLGSSSVAGVGNLLDGGFSTLVDRLKSMTDKITSNTAHAAASSGVHGVAGKVVGTTDTQTLTNKTLVSPTITGPTPVGGAQFTGNTTFTNNVTINGTLTTGQPPVISDFTTAQHDHSSPAKGGAVPIASVTGLQSALDGKSPAGHLHTKGQITDFSHTLDSHTGSLDKSRITGLGTAAPMNVPAAANTAATASQVVRGDDPRLTNARTPGAHAATHAANGSDPITPAAIGAALSTHNHTRGQITDFAHPLYSPSHTGTLPQTKIDNLVDDLAAKLPVNGKAADSFKLGGRTFTVSATAPANPALYDVWIDV